MPMNATDPKFLSTHIRRPRNIKRRFSAALALWCAYRKRPAGGCAGAGTHLYRAAGRERASIGLAPSPCPAPLAGRRHGRPGPVLAGFTRMHLHLCLNQAGMPRKAGKRAAQEEADSAAAAPKATRESNKRPLALGRPSGRKDASHSAYAAQRPSCCATPISLPG